MVIANVAEMTDAEADEAIRAAGKALPSFRSCSGRERGRMLHKWHELLLQHGDDLAKLITAENGKPLADAKAEVHYSAGFLEWFAGEASRLCGETIPVADPRKRVFTLKEPVGVCGLITPWNMPAAMIARKAGPALAAGCAVVIKSPGETPLAVAALVELSQRAGIPPGVLNLVTAMKNTPSLGLPMTSSPVVKKLSFTGSTATGKLLMKQCSSTLKKLSFGLGGNAPFIVFQDADIPAAVMGAIFSRFRSSGQTCVCSNRLFVHDSVYDGFCRALVEKVQMFKVGPGMEQGVTHGPLIHGNAVKKAHEHVRDAVAQGAQLLTGGSVMTELGPNFFEPTVLSEVRPSMKIVQEETFGPVAGILRFQSEDEVLRLANDSELGLAAYVFSSYIERCYRVAEALEVGMVGVNTGSISDPAAPFGGIKESGFGREGGGCGIEEYLTIKAVTLGFST